jgi:hypothetical protein
MGAINNRSVTIVGGYPNCSAESPAVGARTQIGPLPNASTRLLTMQATQVQRVSLRQLNFQGPAVRGAISAHGPVDLTLENVTVNGAGSAPSFIEGGGISLSDEAFLFLRTGVEILANQASRGGGIHCQANSRVLIQSGTALISSNVAQLGGGLYLDRCAFDWGSQEPSTQGGIKGNTASAAGGGIFALESDLSGSGVVPRAVSANFALQSAGGLLLQNSEAEFDAIEVRQNRSGDASSPGQTGFCGGILLDRSAMVLNRFQIDGNVAWRNGGGLCAFASSFRNGDPISCPNSDCRTISDNRAGLSGVGEAGALQVRTSSVMQLAETRLERNSAPSASVLSAEDGDAVATQTQILLRNALLSRNVGNGLIQTTDSSLTVAWTTIADNVSGATTIFDFSGNALMFEGALFQAALGTTVLSAPFGTSLTTRCVGAHETQSLLAHGGSPALVNNPGFVDAPNGNYDLIAVGGAVDFCAGTAADPSFDIRGAGRPINQPIGNVAGPFDLGAFESQLLVEAIFRSGFE